MMVVCIRNFWAPIIKLLTTFSFIVIPMTPFMRLRRFAPSNYILTDRLSQLSGSERSFCVFNGAQADKQRSAFSKNIDWRKRQQLGKRNKNNFRICAKKKDARRRIQCCSSGGAIKLSAAGDHFDVRSSVPIAAVRVFCLGSAPAAE